MVKKYWVMMLVLSFLLSPLPLARAGEGLWQNNGQVVCNSSGAQMQPKLISDGAGGVIIAWMDTRNDGGDIFVQRLNGAGMPQWAADAVVVCDAINPQSAPQLISDGAGGAIIAWYDRRDLNATQIYVQHVDGSGATQWTSNGEQLLSVGSEQTGPQMISDGVGGAIVCWGDDSNANIYAQRIDNAGNTLWANAGIAISNAFASHFPQIASDGNGGAMITWQDTRSGNFDIYAQSVNAAGVVQWAANGIVICSDTGLQEYPQAVSDGNGGVIITWQDNRSGNYDIYAQRINSAGAVQWAVNGILCGTAQGVSSDPEHLHLISDGNSGAILAWQDHRRATADIYAQRVNGSGTFLWSVNGTVICNAASAVTGSTYPQLVSDGSGGTIIGWQDSRSGYNQIYAQRVNGSGSSVWRTNGEVICDAANNVTGSRYPQLALDSNNGAIIVWEDARAEYNLYAQRVVRPRPKILGINSPGVRGAIFHAIITGFDFKDDRGQVAAVALTRTAYANIPATNIHVTNSGSMTCDFDLSAVALGDWGVVATDSLMQLSREQITFSIQAIMPTLTPTPSSSITPTLSPTSTPTPTTPATSTDRPVEDTCTMEHRIIRPGQNQPLKVSIALLRREKVLISIYSRQGMFVKTLADSELDAGTYEFSWDSVTQNGRAVGSGIYVVIIRTDSLRENRKFVLIR